MVTPDYTSPPRWAYFLAGLLFGLVAGMAVPRPPCPESFNPCRRGQVLTPDTSGAWRCVPVSWWSYDA